MWVLISCFQKEKESQNVPFIQMLFLKCFEVKIACQGGKFGGEVGGGGMFWAPSVTKTALGGEPEPYPT